MVKDGRDIDVGGTQGAVNEVHRLKVTSGDDVPETRAVEPNGPESSGENPEPESKGETLSEKQPSFEAAVMDEAAAAPLDVDSGEKEAEADPSDVPSGEKKPDESQEDGSQAADEEVDTDTPDDKSDESESSEIPRPRQPTYIETLEQRLHEAQDQLREYIHAYKTVKEDTEELRARLEREAEKELLAMRGRLLSELFEVMDNLERSIGSAETDFNAEAFMKGIKMVQAQFLEKLQGMGLELIEPVGEVFDPNEADALNLVPISDPEQDEKVVYVYARGYRMNDRVVRPAQVGVGRFSEEA